MRPDAGVAVMNHRVAFRRAEAGKENNETPSRRDLKNYISDIKYFLSIYRFITANIDDCLLGQLEFSVGNFTIFSFMFTFMTE